MADAERPLGVVLVHGIGRQQRGETTAKFVEGLRRVYDADLTVVANDDVVVVVRESRRPSGERDLGRRAFFRVCRTPRAPRTVGESRRSPGTQVAAVTATMTHESSSDESSLKPRRR